MASTSTAFTESIAEDIKKYEGVRVLLKAGLLESLLVKKTSCDNLHPNPEDEFSIPAIGPSYRIISDYEKDIRDCMNKGMDPFSNWEDPLYVQKMYPEGYMLLNGHHRWAAAKRIGLKKVPVKIVSLTEEKDVKEMLEGSSNEKRITLDLDELVFCNGPEDEAEQALLFPFNMIYKERIRLGIPALCSFFTKKGYDIWVYTSKFYSLSYLKALFRKYHINPVGIIVGTSRAKRLSSSTKRNIEKLIADKYKETINLYPDMVLVIHSRLYDFDQYELDNSDGKWSLKVMELFKDKDETVE